MTELADELLSAALRRSAGMEIAEHTVANRDQTRRIFKDQIEAKSL
jgi:hypothetical protein